MPADFLVNRTNLRQCRFMPEQTGMGLSPGQALLRVDKFAFSSNNVTYAAFGEAMAYWAFFPAPSGWGRIPVWGYAQVEKSRNVDLSEGERVFGYLPMSSHLIVQPGKVGLVRFTDASPHRQKLPAAYQSYTRCASDTYYEAEFEDHQAIFRPLFVTALLIENFLGTQDYCGAKRLLLSSASSKTALSLAQLARRSRKDGIEIVGLTSPANRLFCDKTGLYDQVVTYPNLPGLDASVPTVYVDMAGNGRLLHDVHHKLDAQLKYSCMVGGTHWEQRETQHALPGARPTFFFAPTHYARLAKEWTVPGLESRIAERMREFFTVASPWLQIIRDRGPEAVERVYRQMLEGQTPPEQAHMLSL